MSDDLLQLAAVFADVSKVTLDNNWREKLKNDPRLPRRGVKIVKPTR